MPDTDCEKDYQRCKSACFDVLVGNLVSAEDDQAKIDDAVKAYKKCRRRCKKAKEICEQEDYY